MTLAYCKFDLNLVSLADIHVGNGETIKKHGAGEKSLDIAIFNRGLVPHAPVESETGSAGLRELPCIEATSLRGGLREVISSIDSSGENTKLVLGPDDLDESSSSETDSGILWIRGGCLDSSGPMVDCDLLPMWDKDVRTYIDVQHARNRNSGATKDGALFGEEVVPAGHRFKYSCVFRGSPQSLENCLLPVLNSIASSTGITIGANEKYNRGRLRLDEEKISITHHYFSVSKQEMVSEESCLELKAAERSGSNCQLLTLDCNGAYLFSDPSNSGLKDENGREYDLLPLRRSINVPEIKAKPFLQNLRAMSERLEIELALKDNRFDYQDPYLPVDDPNKPFDPSDDLSSLNVTQRLFGVPGWMGTLGISGFEAGKKPQGDAIQYYSGYRSPLDVHSQEPIHGAMLEYRAPVSATASIQFSWDEHRYMRRESEADGKRLVKEDREFIEALFERARCKGLWKMGAMSSIGLGWFEAVIEEGP